MNILIAAQRKPINDADAMYRVLRSAGHTVAHLYKGAPLAGAHDYLLDEARLEEQLAAIVNRHGISLLYLRADWFDPLYREFGERILACPLGVPTIFGLHCHTAVPHDTERGLFERADALIALNQEAKYHFETAYDLRKPTFIMPSLLLPSRAWYDCPLLPKLSAADDRIHAAIPSGVIRVSGLPRQPVAKVPIENFVIDRYDYYQITRLLTSEGIHAHLFGRFAVFPDGDPAPVEQLYRGLAEESGLVHIEGTVDQEEFATQLSRYDLALLTGFIPGQHVPAFDHMNYQLRFNSALAARLPVAVARGTSRALEQIIDDSGAGLVFDSVSEIVSLCGNEASLRRAREAAVALQDEHSIEHWVQPLINFFEEVVRGTPRRTPPDVARTYDLEASRPRPQRSLLRRLRGKIAALIRTRSQP